MIKSEDLKDKASPGIESKSEARSFKKRLAKSLVSNIFNNSSSKYNSLWRDLKSRWQEKD